MWKWLTSQLLRVEFTKVDLPLMVNNKAISLLASNDTAELVEAYFAANNKLQSDLFEELHSAFTALSNSSGKSPEEDAERLIVLNTLRAKYQVLFTALDELKEAQVTKDTNGA